MFDINDFDETCPGPFEWDVKRLAASFEIAARTRGFDPGTAGTIVLRCARAYREAMTSFAALTNLDVWYARLEVETIIARWRGAVSAKEAALFDEMTAKARTRDSTKALAKLTRRVDGMLRIVSDPPLVVPIDQLTHEGGSTVPPEDLRTWLEQGFATYRRSLEPAQRRLLGSYRAIDFARKVVGVGSVGTRCWIAL